MILVASEPAAPVNGPFFAPGAADNAEEKNRPPLLFVQTRPHRSSRAQPFR